MFRVPKATVTMCDRTIVSRELIANKNPTSNVLFSIMNPYFFSFVMQRSSQFRIHYFLTMIEEPFHFMNIMLKNQQKLQLRIFNQN